jgi:hypothetical protein
LKRSLAFAFAVLLAACSGAHDPQADANAVTRAIYDDDVTGVSSHLDSTLQPQLTRAGVGLISDKMHALGNYTGLTFLARDATKNEYTYQANFAKGKMNVIVRLDADGKFAAYRVFPLT